MKLEEMADLLDGLAGFLEKHAQKSALNDLRAVSQCLRRFAGENVSTFCTFVAQAKEGKAAPKKGAAADLEKVNEVAARIRRFLDNRHEQGYQDIQVIVRDLGKLKAPDLKALGALFDFAFTSETKTKMVSTLNNWLTNVKMSADQSSFSLSPASAR